MLRRCVHSQETDLSAGEKTPYPDGITVADPYDLRPESFREMRSKERAQQQAEDNGRRCGNGQKKSGAVCHFELGEVNDDGFWKVD